MTASDAPNCGNLTTLEASFMIIIRSTDYFSPLHFAQICFFPHNENLICLLEKLKVDKTNN